MEICEIICVKAGFLGARSYFMARAAGAKGVYEAGRSTMSFRAYDAFRVPKGGALEPVPYDDGRPNVALNEIMSSLSASGWQLDGKSGPGWWEYKYRR